MKELPGLLQLDSNGKDALIGELGQGELPTFYSGDQRIILKPYKI
jgi:hypothetical protein